MRLNPQRGLDFDAYARSDASGNPLQLRLGPLQFDLTELEAIALANRLLDAVAVRRNTRKEHP